MTDRPTRLGELTAPVPAAAPAGRRRGPRGTCATPPPLGYVVQPGFLTRLGYALDVSAGGLAFLASAPLAPGSDLSLQVLGGRPSVSRARVARVAHCSPVGDGWRVGCAVSPPFSPEEIDSLL